MNRIVFPPALALILGSSLAFAQQAPEQQQAPAAQGQAAPMQHHRHAPNPQFETRHLTKQLGLTQQQTALLEPILADRDQKMTQLRGSGMTREQMHQQAHAIQQGTMEQLSSVLNPEQLQQLKSMHHRHGGHWQGQGAPAPAQPGL